MNEVIIECVDEFEEIIVVFLNDVEIQIEEFEYMFYKFIYRVFDREYFKLDDKVRFYIGLLFYQVFIVILNYVVSYVSRRIQIFDFFQEFVIVLMKLRFNMSFQDLVYRFMVLVLIVFRIFWSWIIVMDNRLSGFFYWLARESFWKIMLMCFKYSFGNKIIVVIDCFEVFIDKLINLLVRVQIFSFYKYYNIIKILIGIIL